MRFSVCLCFVCLTLTTTVSTPLLAQQPHITVVSVSSEGVRGDHQSEQASISADGRFVAFESLASNFVPGVNVGNIYVHDRQTRETICVSNAPNGVEANDVSAGPTISADGRYVSFSSRASNLVPNDANDAWDIFIHDRLTGETTRASVSSEGVEGNQDSYGHSVSDDGRFIAFTSIANNLVPNDTNNLRDIHINDVFVRDRNRGETVRVSVSSEGRESASGGGSPVISSNGQLVFFESTADDLVEETSSYDVRIYLHNLSTHQTTLVTPGGSPSISNDGRYVAFVSPASNLVPNDTNNTWDVFVMDRQTGEISRVSVGSDGTQGTESSTQSTISDNGRFVAFVTQTFNFRIPFSYDGTLDVFIHDRQDRQTTRVSVPLDGGMSNDWSRLPSLSANGDFIAFQSWATNLVPRDANSPTYGTAEDVFVAERNRLPPPATHAICRNNSCVALEGTGDNECQTDRDCLEFHRVACTEDDHADDPTVAGTVQQYVDDNSPIPLKDECHGIDFLKEYICDTATGQHEYQWYQCKLCRTNVQGVGACEGAPGYYITRIPPR